MHKSFGSDGLRGADRECSAKTVYCGCGAYAPVLLSVLMCTSVIPHDMAMQHKLFVLLLFTSWLPPNQLAEVQASFNALGGFPCVLGAIHGAHVRIQAPEDNEEVHVNRHVYHSMNVQLVVDPNCRILDVVAKLLLVISMHSAPCFLSV